MSETSSDSTDSGGNTENPEPRRGRVVGKVEYREGDGAKIAIRPGPVQFTLTENDATLSWNDGETRGSAAMPLSEFNRYCSEGAIVEDDARPASHRADQRG